MYSDSILKHVPAQLEEMRFQIHALPGGSIGGRRKMGDFIERQDHTNPEMPDMVILHVGTNDLPFLHDHPGFLNSTVKQHLKIAKELKQRYMGIELMVSMPLPLSGDEISLLLLPEQCSSEGIYFFHYLG